jgi:hypothetical protein
VKLLLTRKLRIAVAALRAKARSGSRSAPIYPAGMVYKNFTALHKKYSFVHPAVVAAIWMILL